MRNLYKKRIYMVWWNMIQRCYNPNATSYEDYGLQGIKVCKRWRGVNGFKNFLNDMGKRSADGYQLDREDGDYGYVPWNCRWCTARENQLNTSNTRWITFQEKTICMSDWAKELNINLFTLNSRLNQSGWSIKKAFTTPVRKCNGK